jgi:hypothetical protein
MAAGALLVLMSAVAVWGAVTHEPTKESIFFPNDESVLDVRRAFGAKGDGETDDTEALQKGIEASCRGNEQQSKVLYIPNGVYRVSQPLVVTSRVGPWVYGESRDGVIIMEHPPPSILSGRL